MVKKLTLLQELNEALNPKYCDVKIPFAAVKTFAQQLDTFLQKQSEDDEEDVMKTNLRDFFRETFYKELLMFTDKDRYDLTIQETRETPIKVLFELKRKGNKTEMCTKDDLNKKALQELVYYYMQERCKTSGGNVFLCHLIVTNGNEFFVFPAREFEQKIYSQLRKSFADFSATQSSTTAFYNDIAAPMLRTIQTSNSPLTYTHFRLDDFRAEIAKVLNDEESPTLTALYKFFSPTHLLKKRIQTDPNQLDRQFYNELLHILGLEERKEESGGKYQIARKEEPDLASLVEQTYNKVENNWIDFTNTGSYGSEREEQMFNVTLELVITWLNRILFLKLLEAQLLDYNGGDVHYKFLNTDTISGFTQLNDLFFDVLAVPIQERKGEFCARFNNVPYLNSSLFERTELEKTVKINSLQSRADMPLYTRSILKKGLQEEKGEYPLFGYLFAFLEAYDFGTHSVDQSTKTLINASALGLIFEKINGHKDGAVFTPGYITSFVCRETIRRTTIDKFNAQFGWECCTIVDLQNELQRNKIDDEQAIALINSLRICDPAVGSGHFLVSALNELIFMKYDLNLLKDQGSGRIFEFTLRIENDELRVYDRNGELFHYNKNDEKSQRAQQTLFDEKRYLIEHCLFGVDINPTSVQICRLRLWIELLKHAYYTQASGYKALETLPNIDINIKCGNSLLYTLPLEGRWFAPNSRQIQETIAEYYRSSNKERKQTLWEAIEKYKDAVKTKLWEEEKKEAQEKENYWAEEVKKLTQRLEAADKNEWNKYDPTVVKKELKQAKAEHKKACQALEEVERNCANTRTFEWRLEFHDVWGTDGAFVGFDAVIGNPPYIQLQSMGNRATQLKQQGYETYDSMGDIYSLFYELGYKLLRPDGKLCFITSNKWMRAGYGEKTREFFSTKTNPILLIDFAGVKIFENATVDTNILLFSKSENQHKTLCAVANKHEKDSLNNLSLFVEQQHTICDFSNSDSWVILSPIEQSIKRKIEAVGIPLKDWDIQINYGIKTGCNEAFIISTEKREEILANCQTEEERRKTDELIRPILRGRDIKRYSYEWAELYLIATFPARHYNIDDYPAVRDYLLSFGIERLEQTGQTYIIDGKAIKARKKTNNKWFETQDSIAYWEDFGNPKIIWKIIGSQLAFTIDNNGIMLNNACYLLTGNHLAHILGFLNSSPLIWYSEITNMNKTGVGDAQVGAQNIILFPIPSIIDEEVVEIVEQLLSTPDSSNLKRILSERIYAIYRLDIEERSYLESLNL